MSKVAILTLNWNNWEDSKNFLDSVFFLDYKNYDIIFIDNGSNDNSVDNLISFLTNKNLDYKIIDENNTIENITENSQFYIIKNDENLGYTGGFNKGLEFILNNARDYEFIWILNNDTILNKLSLGNLVKCYYEAINKNIKVGAIGSKILYPNGELQMLGGCTLYPIIGNSIFRKKDNQRLDYISGASLFMPVDVVRYVGLFDERFFLYWDDADYGIRIKKKGYKLIYCSNSIVYHKEGGTAGRINKVNDYYWVRNGFLFTKKHYPYFLPFVFFSYFFKYTIVRKLRNLPFNFDAYVRGVKDFLTNKFGGIK